MSEQETEIMQFPCDFPIKIMGVRSDEFAQTIAELVIRHCPDFQPATMEMRPSSKGTYLGLTCTVRAQSKAQLDGLYMELTKHPLVKYAL